MSQTTLLSRRQPRVGTNTPTNGQQHANGDNNGDNLSQKALQLLILTLENGPTKAKQLRKWVRDQIPAINKDVIPQLLRQINVEYYKIGPETWCCKPGDLPRNAKRVQPPAPLSPADLHKAKEMALAILSEGHQPPKELYTEINKRTHVGADALKPILREFGSAMGDAGGDHGVPAAEETLAQPNAPSSKNNKPPIESLIIQPKEPTEAEINWTKWLQRQRVQAQAQWKLPDKAKLVSVYSRDKEEWTGFLTIDKQVYSDESPTLPDLLLRLVVEWLQHRGQITATTAAAAYPDQRRLNAL